MKYVHLLSISLENFRIGTGELVSSSVERKGEFDG